MADRAVGAAAMTSGVVARRPRSKALRQLLVAAPFMLPGFVLILLFVVYPLLRGVQMSLYQWNLMAPAQSTFIGFDNYGRAFGDPTFWMAVRNTGLYAVITVPLQMLFGLGAALLLNQAVRGRTFFRALFYLPVVTSWLIVSFVFRYLFDDMGPINYALVNVLHLIDRPIGWLHESWVTAEVPINALGVWKGIGWNMVIFLAGLQSVPPELHEAAAVDGAGVWQRFRYVTLPLLRPTILFVAIVLTIGAFNVFLSVFLLTGGGPLGQTETMLSYMYTQALKFLDFGYGTTIGLLLGVALIVLAFIQRRLLRGSMEAA